MKKIIALLMFVFVAIAGIRTNLNYDDKNIKAQFKKSAESALKILAKVEKAEDKYTQNSISYKKIMKEFQERKQRVNFVLWYYNNLKMIENDLDTKKYPKEKKLREKLLFLEANRIYYEKFRETNWLRKAHRRKIDEKFLEFFINKDRFFNLVLRVYFDQDQDLEKTKKFVYKAYSKNDTLGFIFRKLTQHVQVKVVKKYRIHKGDTLGKLFEKRWREIAEYNKINPKKLRIGQILIDPRTIVNDIPRDIDETIQYAIVAAEQLGKTEEEKIKIVKYTVGILRIETKQGIKVGTGNYLYDMKPEERKIFLKICIKLGRIPELTPVSKKPSYGWGGAMGPAQFLPSTWLAYEPNVAALTLKKFVSPFSLKDSVFAVASKLVSGGINSKLQMSKQRAVMLYLAGTHWDKNKYQWYWNKVNKEAEKIKIEIKK